MPSDKMNSSTRFLLSSFAVLFCIASSGCVTFSSHAIPADRLPPELKAIEKSARVPINPALLGQRPQREHQIVPGDVIGVYIRGLLPIETTASIPMVNTQGTFQAEYYPPRGLVATASVGLPFQVGVDGTLNLPSLGLVNVAGLTLNQASQKIASLCIEKQVVVSGVEYVHLSLVRSNVMRVVVLREEVQQDMPTQIRKEHYVLAKRGYAHVLDLPEGENDVLHALTASGGLPGSDACNEVWILRQEMVGEETMRRIWDGAANQQDPTEFINCLQPIATSKRIPLWTYEGCPTTISPEDVVLHDGDVVLLKPRDNEFFYTGGLLPGGEIPLPRDRDVDIIEAIAIANGSTGAPGGAPAAVFRSGAGPGNVIPPSRAVIVRKVAGREQVAIRVDLNQAVRNSKQRVIIQPGDLIMLNYKPNEAFGNILLNFVSFSWIWTRS